MNPDDPKLTAYALDELDPAERIEVEELLHKNPEALAEVEDTERLAAQLRREFHAEPAAPLTAEQRTEVLVAANAPVHAPASPTIVPLRRGWARPLALAASVAVLGGVAYLALDSFQKRAPRPVALSRSDVSSAPSVTTTGTPAFLGLQLQHEAIGLSDPVESTAALSTSGVAPTQPEIAAVITAPSGEAKVAMPALQKTAESFALAGLAPADEVTILTSNNPEPDPAAGTPIMVGRRLATSYGQGSTRVGAKDQGGKIASAKPAFALAPSASATVSSGTLASVPVTASARGGALAINENAVDALLADPTGNVAAASPAKPQHFVTTTMHDAAGAVISKAEQAVDFNGFINHGSPIQTTGGVDVTALGQRNYDGKKQVGELRKELNESIVQLAKAEAGQSALGEEYRSKVQKLHELEGEVRQLEAAQKSLGDVRLQREPSNTESYDAIQDNDFLTVRDHALSTFSIDVDTASYANVRRFLNEQRLPPKGAVRIEELLNYFDYDYPQPEGEAPFSASMEVAACPWTPEHRLVRVGLKGREIHPDKRPASNLVFLVDVSGSMQPENKLPLVKKSLRQLVEKLGGEDTVAIAVYAGASGCVLEPTNKKSEMRAALDRLESGGSTNGAAGIQLAYQLAERSFIKGGVNRVILATDGDFNVGVTNQSDLVELIEKKAKSGVFLTVLGFGMGNLKDSTLEKLANKGNGNYAYIDTFNEARKVLVEQMSGTLVTIAKDVKIQVEFNPAQVGSYRLIGYENRLLKKEDFNDDTKDAGEIGAGHTVTALYEVVPAGTRAPGSPAIDPLKYQSKPVELKLEVVPLIDANRKADLDRVQRIEEVAGSTRTTRAPSDSRELLTLKLRYKAPDGDTSKLLEFPLTDDGKSYERSSRDFRFAAAVASFGMLLRDSPHRGKANWNSTLELAVEGKGEDRSGYRAEFVSLIERAKAASR